MLLYYQHIQGIMGR